MRKPTQASVYEHVEWGRDVPPLNSASVRVQRQNVAITCLLENNMLVLNDLKLNKCSLY